MTENTPKIPAAYRDNMLLAVISALVGKLIQKIKVTLPIEELTGDYLANLVTGLTPKEREFFAASLDAQVITGHMTCASVITESRESEGPHWIDSLYEIIYVGDTVYVEVTVITCVC